MTKMKIQKIVREVLLELHSEEQEVEAVVNELLVEFETLKVPAEVARGWYCGVTGQETRDDELELERIKDHYDDNFPQLDIGAIVCQEVSSIAVAMEVEKIMRDEHKFDIGKRQNEPKDGNQIWVYIFRKVVK